MIADISDLSSPSSGTVSNVSQTQIYFINKIIPNLDPFFYYSRGYSSLC